MLIAYAGVVTLFGRDFTAGSATLLGDLVVSVSALLLGERTVYMARAVQRVDPVKLLVFQSAIGSTCFLLASLWWEWGLPVRPTGRLGLSLAAIGGPIFLALIVAGMGHFMRLFALWAAGSASEA